MISNEPTLQVVDTNSELRNSVYSTLKYFNIFQHPLYLHEVHKFLQQPANRHEVVCVLNDMVREGEVFLEYGLYALENSTQIFLKRIVGADVAAEKMKDARRCAKIISAFPFVKSVCISGSLSKGYADERSDIDFFIVTAHRRLWISRTLLHLFKKFTFIINRQHSFCMNYFIDEGELCLEEQNIFTATELATLIPLYNNIIYRKLVDDNRDWMTTYLPNLTAVVDENAYSKNTLSLKTAMEWILNKCWPEAINGSLMRITDTLWRYKWRRRNYPMEDYDLAMKTKWYVSKQHPLNYQKKVLEKNTSHAAFA